uniref:Alpha-beta hydrolase n=1 Tax=Phaffia rhodozyma TaxID=264483 RepID=A0A1C9U691_PHARH|nr:alpha -beta hydrolase [Phaffia rhodozyma]
MPYVKINSNTGTQNIYYNISTPTEASADQIDPTRPTVLFLHPIFIASEIFHPQFTDPLLRKFNLVALDSRLHGLSEGVLGSSFTFFDAADDINNFTNAVQLPPVIIVGVSMGSSIALHFATKYSSKVLGLFLISPLTAWEPEDVAIGRREIWELWKEGIEMNDADLTEQAISGALQLGFNGQTTETTERMLASSISHSMNNWSTEQGIKDLKTISVDFFADRKPLPLNVLSSIQCPLQMIHAGADVAYSLEDLLEKKKDFDDAGLKTNIVTIPRASHFANVIHAEKINPLLSDFVAANASLETPAELTHLVISPFDHLFETEPDEADDDY